MQREMATTMTMNCCWRSSDDDDDGLRGGLDDEGNALVGADV